MGVVGLDDLSLELAASLIRSGYAVKAFEVYFDYFFISLHFIFLVLMVWIFLMFELWYEAMELSSYSLTIFFFLGVHFHCS